MYDDLDEYHVKEPIEQDPHLKIETTYFTTPVRPVHTTHASRDSVESVKKVGSQGAKISRTILHPSCDVSREEEETPTEDLSILTKIVDSEYIITDGMDEEENIHQEKEQPKPEEASLSGLTLSRAESEEYIVPLREHELIPKLEKQYPGDTIHIEIVRQIGGKEQKKVYLGYIKETNGPVVIKQFTMKANEENLGEIVEMLVKEIEMIRSFNNPNIIRYFKFHRSSFNKSSNKLEYSIIMEYISDGSLADLLKSNARGLTKPTIQKILRQILNGLKYLHKHRVIHRNLTPSNILVNKNTYKITDFNLAARVKEQLSNAKRSRAGNGCYIAPEVISGNPYSYSADIWSFGCLAFELFSGKKLHGKSSEAVAMRKMVKENALYENCPEYLLKKLKSREWSDLLNLLKSCLERDPIKRPTAAKLLNHPFVKKLPSIKKPNKVLPKIQSKPVIQHLNPELLKGNIEKVKPGIRTPHNKIALKKRF